MLSHLPPDHKLGVPNWRVSLPYDSSVLTIQITAGERTAVVPNNYPIWVQHWDQFENKFFSQFL